MTLFFGIKKNLVLPEFCINFCIKCGIQSRSENLFPSLYLETGPAQEEESGLDLDFLHLMDDEVNYDQARTKSLQIEINLPAKIQLSILQTQVYCFLSKMAQGKQDNA